MRNPTNGLGNPPGWNQFVGSTVIEGLDGGRWKKEGACERVAGGSGTKRLSFWCDRSKVRQSVLRLRSAPAKFDQTFIWEGVTDTAFRPWGRGRGS